MRNYLFLQGPCTPFFGRLGDRLRAAGHGVFRVNFCAGDLVYWGTRPAWSYRGDRRDLSAYLEEIYRRYGITDQILFGDRRPVHRPATDRGERFGVRTHVFEEGYFRPHWVTLEREGVNGHSLLPRDPDWFRATARHLRPARETVFFRSPFRIRAAHDVAYHTAGALNPVLFPRYRRHAPVVAPVEYLAYGVRFSRLRFIRAREFARVQTLAHSGRPFFLLPLQLNGDAQILHHSRFKDMRELIEEVLESFARHAPANTCLAIKNHPLDMGLMNFGQFVRACGDRLGLTDRTLYLEDGDLSTLLRHAQGVVTVNSTVGIVALEHAVPTLTLGDPIYNLPGLTFQGVLEHFWRDPEPPDPEFFAAFRQVVMSLTQINGGFYCRKGIDLAVANAYPVLTAERSPLEEIS